MSDLSTKRPTVERAMPSHLKPQAIKGTPSLKAPPKKAPHPLAPFETSSPVRA